MTRTLFVDGREVAADAPWIRADERGFTLGDGLFETMRGYDGVPFRLDAHLERLRRGAERIGLVPPAELRGWALAAVAAHRSSDSAIRVTLAAGTAEEGLARGDVERPTAVVSVRPYSPRPEWYSEGLSAVRAPGRLNEQSPTAGLKRLGYLDAIVALRLARRHGADEALFLDTAGHLAEASASNLFLVEGDGVLLTPPLTCGVLPGITRAVVLELAPALGLEVREQELAPERLERAAEAFLTSSLREIVPLCAWEGRPIGEGRPGPTTLRLLRSYRERVRAETAAAVY